MGLKELYLGIESFEYLRASIVFLKGWLSWMDEAKN
jgi:hypothetical protein